MVRSGSPMPPAVSATLSRSGEGLWTRISPYGLRGEVRHVSDSLVSCRAAGTKAMGLGCWHLLDAPPYRVWRRLRVRMQGVR